VTQVEIEARDQWVAVDTVGGGLRAYAAGGRDLIDGYPAGEPATSGRGQVLIPWPNRLEDGAYEFDGRRHQLPLTEPERAVFQAIIDEMYGRFVRLIVKARKLPEDRVRAAADGRVTDHVVSERLQVAREPTLAATEVERPPARWRHELEELVAVEAPVAVVIRLPCPGNELLGVRFPGRAEVSGVHPRSLHGSIGRCRHRGERW